MIKNNMFVKIPYQHNVRNLSTYLRQALLCKGQLGVTIAVITTFDLLYVTWGLKNKEERYERPHSIKWRTAIKITFYIAKKLLSAYSEITIQKLYSNPAIKRQVLVLY